MVRSEARALEGRDDLLVLPLSLLLLMLPLLPPLPPPVLAPFLSFGIRPRLLSLDEVLSVVVVVSVLVVVVVFVSDVTVVTAVLVVVVVVLLPPTRPTALPTECGAIDDVVASMFAWGPRCSAGRGEKYEETYGLVSQDVSIYVL